MLKDSTIQTINAFWADYFGCVPATFLSQDLQIVTHGQSLADYSGVFVLSRQGRTIVSVPQEHHALRTALANLKSFSLPDLSQLNFSHIIGPAYIGYLDLSAEHDDKAELLKPQHSPAVERLRAACKPEEWEHGGCNLSNAAAAFGVFFGEELISLASYEIWGRSIAHISVITTPSFRRSGHAQNTVAAAATHALRSGLIPQYRTLQSNLPSLSIAENLGFSHYATSLAIRLR